MTKNKQNRSTKQKESEPDSLQNYAVKVENPRRVYGLFTSEFSGLTPNNMHLYLETNRKGLCFWKGLLFEEMLRRDLRFGAIVQTRLLSAANKEWKLTYRDDSPVPQTKQDETIKFLLDNLQQINLPKFNTGIIRSQIVGATAFESIFKVSGSRIYWDKIDKIPNHLLCFDDLSNEIKFLNTENADAQKLKNIGWLSLTSQDRINLSGLVLEGIEPRKITTAYSLDGDAQNPFMNGCWDSMMWAYLFKNYGLKDWSIWIERFAMPSVLGKYPPLMNKADKEKLFQAVKNFGHLFKGNIPNTADITFLSDATRSTGSNTFDSYVQYWNKEATIRVLGQSLTTDIGNVGSKAAADTHDAVRWDIEIADMMVAKHTVNSVIKTLLSINEPDIIDYPVYGYEDEEDIDYKIKRSEIFRNLRIVGYKPLQQNIEEEFNVKVEPVDNAAPVPGADGVQNYISTFIKEVYDGLH